MLAKQVLFQGEALPRALPVCDHYAGTEARMRKALQMQSELGPVFDITFDCEDGAPVGKETEHAELVANILVSPENKFNRVGIRIHDPSHPAWQSDIASLIPNVGNRVAFVTIPKVMSASQTQVIIEIRENLLFASTRCCNEFCHFFLQLFNQFLLVHHGDSKS